MGKLRMHNMMLGVLAIGVFLLSVPHAEAFRFVVTVPDDLAPDVRQALENGHALQAVLADTRPSAGGVG